MIKQLFKDAGSVLDWVIAIVLMLSLMTIGIVVGEVLSRLIEAHI